MYLIIDTHGKLRPVTVDGSLAAARKVRTRMNVEHNTVGRFWVRAAGDVT